MSDLLLRIDFHESLSPAYSGKDGMDLVDKDLAPHSRWQPIEELSAFVHTIKKPLTRLE